MRRFLLAVMGCTVLLLIPTALAATDCSAVAQNVAASGDGSVSFDDRNPLGGASNIDKIVEIEVFAGNFAFNFVVSKLCTTYRKKNQQTQKVCNGNGGTSQGRVVVPEGAYVQRVNTRVGDYVDWVSFTLTNGDEFGPWGGKRGDGPNRRYANGEGVILSFFGRDGSVMDRIIPVFRVNEMHSVRLEKISYSEVFPPRVDEINFESPDVVRRNDNRDGTTEQTITLALTTTSEETETTTATESQEFSVGLEVTASAGFDVGVASGGVETSFSIGATFTTSREDSSTISKTVTVGDTIEVKAPPGVMVIAELFVRTVEYEYEWEGPAVCTYTYAPTTEIVDDEAKFSGKTFGSRPFEEGTVRFREVARETPPPTMAPSLRVTLPPPTTSTSGVAPMPNFLILRMPILAVAVALFIL